MDTLNISDLSYMHEIEDIEQLQKGGISSQGNDTGLGFDLSADVIVAAVGIAQVNNVGGDATAISNVQVNSIVNGSGEQGNDGSFTL